MRGTVRWIVLSVAVLAIAAVAVWGVQQARQFEAHANAGKTAAVAGMKSLDKQDPAAAAESFQVAGDEFRSAQQLLGPEWLQSIPWVGRQLQAAGDLAMIGVEGSSAGAQAANLIVEASQMSGEDRLNQLVPLAAPHLDAILSSLVVLSGRAARLSTDGLVPPLADAVAKVQAALEPLRPVLDRSQAMLDLERYLLGSQHRFLVVAQNSSELRPAGGFMGTFGFLQLGPDGFALDKFADIYTLPLDTLDLPIPDGGQVNYHHYYFRNSNWWMDYPTSAHQMLRFWENLGQPQIDGILAVDVPLLEQLLTVYGPVTIPQSSTPITAQNAMNLLNDVVQYQSRANDGWHSRKLAIASLVDEVFGRVSRMSKEQIQPTLEVFGQAAAEKHIQMFLTDPGAQSTLVAVGWSGALDPPLDTTDLLAVSNGVIKPSKANAGVTKTLDYQVVLNADGSAQTTLKLGYAKSLLKQRGVPQQWLANYVRVHRLPGVIGPDGTDSGFESLDDPTGLPTFGHYFRLDRGASTSVSVTMDVPQALKQGSPAPVAGMPDPAPDTATGDVWHYRLLLAKQADLVDTKATLSIQVPDGWTTRSATAWFRVGGSPVTASVWDGTVTVSTPMKQDLLVDVVLTRG